MRLGCMTDAMDALKHEIIHLLCYINDNENDDSNNVADCTATVNWLVRR